MRRALVSLLPVIGLSIVTAACAPTPPTPTPAPKKEAPAEPTKAAAAPTKAPEPTAAAQATAAAAPAKKVDFPEKGRTVSLVVGYPAGGGADIGARLLAVPLEKELGTSVQVVNKAGAGSQVGLTEVAKSKPDGYTVGYANFSTIITIYLDPDRKAAFGHKDLLPVALHLTDPMAIAVKNDSPIKDIKGLVDAAKAKPGQIRVGTSGILSQDDLVFHQLMKETGTKFALIAFDGAAPAVTALLGDNIDAVALGFSSMMATAKGGQSRIIASIGDGADEFIPGVKSLSQQGFKGYFGVGRGWLVPGGTPREVVNTLSGAIKRAIDSNDHKSRLKDIGQVATYLDPDQFAKYWDDMETTIKPLLEEAKKASQ